MTSGVSCLKETIETGKPKLTHSFKVNRIHLLELLHMTFRVWIKDTSNEAIDFRKIWYTCTTFILIEEYKYMR